MLDIYLFGTAINPAPDGDWTPSVNPGPDDEDDFDDEDSTPLEENGE